MTMIINDINIVTHSFLLSVAHAVMKVIYFPLVIDRLASVLEQQYTCTLNSTLALMHSIYKKKASKIVIPHPQIIILSYC